MKIWIWCMMGVMMLCGQNLLTSPALAQELPDRFLNVTVAFGGGLNTSGEANHVIIPGKFQVKQGGVVHFNVAGFHQVALCKRGTKVGDITPAPGSLFVNDPDCQVYVGPDPTQSDVDRVESVSFARLGNYLVICNVASHFLEGMHAVIQVQP